MVNGVGFSGRREAGWLAACGFCLKDVVLEEDRCHCSHTLSLPGPIAPCIYFTVQGKVAGGDRVITETTRSIEFTKLIGWVRGFPRALEG